MEKRCKNGGEAVDKRWECLVSRVSAIYLIRTLRPRESTQTIPAYEMAETNP